MLLLKASCPGVFLLDVIYDTYREMSRELLLESVIIFTNFFVTNFNNSLNHSAKSLLEYISSRGT